MRNLILGATLAFCALPGAAAAADLDARPFTPMIPAPPYSWSGLYFGANVGFGWGRSADTSNVNAGGPALFADTQTLNANGVVGGGQIGFNYQSGYWVEGLETDFQGTNQRAAHSFTCPAGVCSAPAVSATLNQDLNWFGTFRGRIGFAPLERVLLYATGGLAYGQVDSTSTLAGTVRTNDINAGWTAGAGIEALVAENWTVRVEYLYVDLGRVSDTFTSTVASIGGAPLGSNFSSHVTDNIVRAGVNYKFNWPVISKY
jgi:outer membrane immunogenic protein